MRLLTVLFSLCCIAHLSVSAQNQISLKLTGASPLKDFQAFELGDTLFLFYTEPAKDIYNALQVTPDGTAISLKMEELHGKLISHLHQNSDSLYVYFFHEEKDQLSMRKLSYHKHQGTKSFSSNNFMIHGNLIGHSIGKDITLVSMSKKDSALYIMHIHDFTKSTERKYRVIPALFKVKPSSIAYLYDHKMISPAEAEAPVKIMHEPGMLYISMDDESLPQPKTTVFTLDLTTEKLSSKLFLASPGKKFSTFISHGKLFKTVKNKGIELTVQDLQTSALLTSMTIKEDHPFKKEVAYERNNVTNEVFNINVWESIDTWGKPFVAVYPLDSVNYILKVGTYEPMKTGGGVPMISGFGAFLSIVSTAGKIASLVASKSESVDRYFYLKGNLKDGFLYYNNSTDITDQIIDNYELTLKVKPRQLMTKGYFKGKQTIYSFYRDETKIRDLLIIKGKSLYDY